MMMMLMIVVLIIHITNDFIKGTGSGEVALVPPSLGLSTM